MTQTKVIASNPAPKLFQSEKTCANCPKFQDYNDRGRGLCKIFDKVVRKQHLFTSDCHTAIEAEELKVLLMTSNAFLKPIAVNFPGRNVYKQDPGYKSSSKIGYIGKNEAGWFANDRHGLLVAERYKSQSGALKALLNSCKPVKHHSYRKPLDTSSNSYRDAIEQELEQLEDIPYSEFKEGSIVKIIDEGEDHTEWASFVVIGKKYNQQRFWEDVTPASNAGACTVRSTESYLTEPNWYYLLASVDRPNSAMFCAKENEICHAEHSHLIDTANVF